MYEQSAPQLRFKPGRFGGHDLVLVGQFDQLCNGCRVEGEGHGVFARVNQLHQFIGATYPADEMYSLVGARVNNAEQRGKKRILQD